MNPKLLKVITQPNESFSIKKYVIRYFYNGWHFHPEIELTHIEKGNGIQFIADNIQRFKTGDLILVGPNLPHFWRWDEVFLPKKTNQKSTATVMHFRKEFWGDSFLELSENKHIKSLLQRSARGLMIMGNTKQFVVEKMNEMLNAKDTERIIILLQILDIISKSGACRPIASHGFQHNMDFKQTDRINNIYTYTLANFKKTISLKEISEVANVSPNSFCRFFKSNTRKTYNRFLQEIRIGHACKLLIENRHSITYICYESGFNNVTNFYKSFKNITDKTPLEYQKTYIKDNSEVEI